MKICITGTPGTGKTKIAKQLSKKLGCDLIELNKFAEEKKLYSGFDRKRACKIVDIKKINKEIKKLKGTFILESHYSHKIDCDRIVLLTAIPAILKKRLEKRNWKREKIQENLDAEIMEIIKSEVYEKFSKKHILEIDTSKTTINKNVAKIIEWLKN